MRSLLRRHRGAPRLEAGDDGRRDEDQEVIITATAQAAPTSPFWKARWYR